MQESIQGSAQESAQEGAQEEIMGSNAYDNGIAGDVALLDKDGGITQPPLSVDEVIRVSGENDYSSSSLLNSNDDIGIQLLCNAAAAQNLDAKYHRRLIFEVQSEQRRVVFRQNSPENSAVYTFCARQKHVAKALMAEQGIPVPIGEVFQDYDSALRYFIAAGRPVTVKPSDGSSGYGVTCAINSEENFSRAWQVALEESRNIVVEQDIPGQDIRVIVIAGKAEAAYVRVPAHVVGDGIHSIRELVDRKNAVRKSNPSLRLDLIARFDLLERNGVSLDEVPPAGEKVQLTSVANTSAGGETVQIFDHLDKELLEIAERAARCFPGLVQVGVDLIYVSPEHWTPGTPRAYVIEVNSNPGICDAVFPSFGKPMDVPGKVISHVFSSQFEPRSGLDTPVTVELAERYPYQDFDALFGSGEQRQSALIQQAAYGLNLRAESIAQTVFRLVGETDQCLFKGAMPENLLMASRKVTRNRQWLDEILPVNPLNPVGNSAKARSQFNQFRFLVVGGKLVSVLLIRARTSRGDVSRVEVGDLVHPSVLPIVEQTMKVVFNPVLFGMDILTRDISADLTHQPWRVVDAMCNPSLAWHHFPDSGPGRDVASSIVRAALSEQVFSGVPPRVCAHLVIRGDVQDVGFRRWMKQMAIMHAVSGWVRNIRENGEPVVETVLEGTPSAVEKLVALCAHGPSSANVETVERNAQSCTGRLNFSVTG